MYIYQGYKFKYILHNKQLQSIVNNYRRYTSINPNLPNNFRIILNRNLSLQCNNLYKIRSPYISKYINHCYYSDKKTTKLSNTEKFKKAIKEYGSTVIVFHISISLISLAVIYVLVSSGVDLSAILQQVGLSDDKINKFAGNTGTFVMAYAIHKVFAPLRMGITLTVTPFIVRYLRNIGWLKK